MPSQKRVFTITIGQGNLPPKDIAAMVVMNVDIGLVEKPFQHACL